jgi:splicing factor U2AF subunit
MHLKHPSRQLRRELYEGQRLDVRERRRREEEERRMRREEEERRPKRIEAMDDAYDRFT